MLVPGLALVTVVGMAVAGRNDAAHMAAADPAATQQPVAATADSLITAAERPAMPRRRETGTDGLMGRLPFDLPPEPVVASINRFTIDDVRAAWSALDTTPPWVRRVRGLGSYTADPYQR